MKTITNASLGFILCCSGILEAQQIALKGGSDGSDGPLVVGDAEERELQLPPDGIFNFTTISVGERAELFFRRNALNTPVYLLATGDVFIDGDIDVRPPAARDSSAFSRRIGGPGGFNGGHGGMGEILPGPGFGPGGGLPIHQVEGAESAGDGNFAPVDRTQSKANVNGSLYGNRILMPLIGGSGGAGYTPGNPDSTEDGSGHGGGGAILIASATRIQITSDGDIFANGRGDNDTRFRGDGSGGAIRLVAPVVEGEGDLDVSGNGGSGGGRIRIDSIVRENMDFRFIPHIVDVTLLVSLGANLVVFPDVVPQLRILEAAGRLVPEGSNEPVSITLAPGAAEA